MAVLAAGSWCRMLLCPGNISGLETGPCHRPLVAGEPPENSWRPALSPQLQQHWLCLSTICDALFHLVLIWHLGGRLTAVHAFHSLDRAVREGDGSSAHSFIAEYLPPKLRLFLAAVRRVCAPPSHQSARRQIHCVVYSLLK